MMSIQYLIDNTCLFIIRDHSGEKHVVTTKLSRDPCPFLCGLWFKAALTKNISSSRGTYKEENKKCNTCLRSTATVRFDPYYITRVYEHRC